MFKRNRAAFVLIVIIGSIFGCDLVGGNKSLDDYIDQVRKEYNIPGMSAAIVADGEVAWSKGYGRTNLETMQPVTSKTAFHLASVSKLFTATALMIAQEKGSLTLDADINKILVPSGFNVDKISPKPITLRHLASHTSAIKDRDEVYFCSYFVGDAHNSNLKLFNLPELEFLNKPLACLQKSPVTLNGFLTSYLDDQGDYYSKENFAKDPQGNYYNSGDYYKISNIATGLEGYLIGLATGVALDQYAKKYIFNPLKMRNTSWRLDDLSPKDIAVPHIYHEQKKKMVPLPHYSLATWPDGGLRSSANDLGRFLAAIMNSGSFDGAKILSRKSVVTMLDMQTVLTADKGEKEYIGVHWSIARINKRSVIGLNGGDPGAFSFLYYDPEPNVGVVLLGNGDLTTIDSGHLEAVLDMLFKKAENLASKD